MPPGNNLACLILFHGNVVCQPVAILMLVQAEYLLSRVMLLKEGIDDTEDLIQIELDQR